jgi:hypothetical protein
MADFGDLDAIDDEDALESLINQTDDLELRRKIRRRQKNIREKRTAAWEAQRQARLEAGGEDAVTMRLRRAEEDKQRKMREFEEMARQKPDGIGAGEEALRQRHANANLERQKSLELMHEVSRVKTAAYNVGVGDFLKEKKENEAGAEKAPDVATANVGSTVGVKRATSLQTRGYGGTAYGAKLAPPGAGDKTTAAGRPVVERNPSAIKQMLLDWCKAQCQGYENVNITNFSSSWADGLAFCALIHHFYPNAFDFSRLNPKNRRGNFTLAFETAEKLADISPLLDVEDMVRMKSPDWKCVFTYVQMFYRRFAVQAKQRAEAAN